MVNQLYRVVVAAAILATATAARAGEPALSAGRGQAARLTSAASPTLEASATKSSANGDVADAESRDRGDAPSRVDCPSDAPIASGSASVEAGYGDPTAQLVWVGP